MADRLLRLDERATDVVVADQAHSHGNARRIGEPNRGAHSGVRNRHDDICFDSGLTRQPPAELGTDLVHALAKHVAVWSREIHVLEDALRFRRGRNGFIDFKPCALTTTTSPGSTSRRYVAPIRSIAHVSEQITHASPSRPMASGRNPCGSRAPINRSFVIMTSEKAPAHL